MTPTEHDRRAPTFDAAPQVSAADRLRSRPARRALVGLAVFLAAISVGLAWSGTDLLLGTAPHLGMLLALGAWLILGVAIRRIDEGSEHELDERQAALRDRVTRQAYIVVTTGSILAVLALLVWLGDEAGRRHLEALFITLVLAGVLTPRAILAWAERDV